MPQTVPSEEYTVPAQLESPIGKITLTKHAMLRFIERWDDAFPRKAPDRKTPIWYFNRLAEKVVLSKEVFRRNNLFALLKYGDQARYLRGGEWIFVIDKGHILRTCYIKTACGAQFRGV